MTTVVYQNEFIFNEAKFFNELFDKENLTEEKKQEVLNGLNLEDIDLKFVYIKDSAGTWFKHCYKGKEKINWKDVPFWLCQHVWSFEKENRIFQ